MRRKSHNKNPGHEKVLARQADISRLRYAKVANLMHGVAKQANRLFTMVERGYASVEMAQDVLPDAEEAFWEARKLVNSAHKLVRDSRGAQDRSQVFFLLVLLPTTEVLAAGATVTFFELARAGERKGPDSKGTQDCIDMLLRVAAALDEGRTDNEAADLKRLTAYRARYNLACFWSTYALYGLAESWFATLGEPDGPIHGQIRNEAQRMGGRRDARPRTSEEAFHRSYEYLFESLKEAPAGEVALLASWATEDPSLEGLFNHDPLGQLARELIGLAGVSTGESQ